MPYHIGVGGAWKLCTKAHVGVGGVWKEVQKMHIGVGGVWKEFYTNLGATLNTVSWLDNAATPTNVASGIQIHSDGTVNRLKTSTYTDQYTWLTGSGANTDYEVRMTTTSGTLSSGDTLGVWHSLGTTRDFNRNNNSDTPSTQEYVGTLEIRMAAAPNTVLATATVTLTATVDA